MIVPSTGYQIEGYNDRALGFSEAFICLYTPILGVEASALYQYLLVEHGRYGTHHRFMQQFGFSLSHLSKLRERLEAMQLLQTYITDEDVYIYVLKSPLAYGQFFEHGLFSSLLLQAVGQVRYGELKQRYQYDIEARQTITKSFSDVFGKIEPLTDGGPTSQKEHPRVDFDWELFDALVGKSFVRLKTIDVNREMIASKAYIFQKSVEEMARIVLESYDVKTHEINSNKLEQLLTEPAVAEKLVVKQMEALDAHEYEKIADFFDGTAPQAFLKARFGHVSQNDLKIIDMCMSQFQFSRGVTNVLIDYVLYTNDQKLTRAYVETIASQLYRKKITTAIDAMRHFTALKEARANKSKQVNNRYQKQTAPKAHQVMVDFDAVETKAPLSDEELAKFLEEYGDVLDANTE